VIAGHLRQLRKSRGLRQEAVARALDLSVSAVSRLERGIRGLRVEQLLAWAGALGYRVELVFWEPVLPEEAYDPESDAPEPLGLDDESKRVLCEVAAALPHMPRPTRQALAFEMQVWREDALRKAGLGPEG
jgi:transcriptional regulator with XRE-family HTH domain